MSATIRCSTHTAHMYVVAHIQTVSNYFLPTVCASAVTSCYIRLRLVSRHLSCLSCQMQVTCLQAETGQHLQDPGISLCHFRPPCSVLFPTSVLVLLTPALDCTHRPHTASAAAYRAKVERCLLCKLAQLSWVGTCFKLDVTKNRKIDNYVAASAKIQLSESSIIHPWMILSNQPLEST